MSITKAISSFNVAMLRGKFSFFALVVLIGLSTAVGCKDDDPGEPVVDPDPDPVEPVEEPEPEILVNCELDPSLEVPSGHVPVCVILDDVPVANVKVMRGGAPAAVLTDDAGVALVPVEAIGEGEIVVTASHPDARTKSATIYPDYGGELLTIRLARFSLSDNRRFIFQDPGAPGESPSSAQCGHCHLAITADWYPSVHRESASNPWVQSLYAGTADAFTNEAECDAGGGRWLMGLEPGTRNPIGRCYKGPGVLPALNDNCGTETSCDSVATQYGKCADCHAPGINGLLGGRDLLGATGIAFEDGVHCDVCHRANEVDLDATEPGVAGRLKLLRPSDPSPSISLGEFLPLTFGPRHDVPNPRMGAVQRDHYANGELCGGCHEYEQEVLLQSAALDLERWPDGRLPVHSTWSEWESGPLGGIVPCNNCHMPPNPSLGNSIDIESDELIEPGIAGGFWRVPGTTRHHQWVGPRFDGQRMLELAAAVSIAKTVADGSLIAEVTVKHVGPGHAIPTGEPLRSIVLSVRAYCDEDELEPSGGHVVPDFGGYEEMRDGSLDWGAWPEAMVGDTLRVVEVTADFHDYRGFGPFGDGSFSPADKGMPVERWVGESIIVTVNEDGSVVLDQPLPQGSRVYRVREAAAGSARQAAGAPGFGFARVMVGADGERMVPHFAAVDVASDNRLLPFDQWTSTHLFVAPCPDPVVETKLMYRSIPRPLAVSKGQAWTESKMQEVRR